MKKIYAGIGARATPEDVLKKMTFYARELAKLDFTLRSGGAAGADKAFADGAPNRLKQIFVPFAGFNAIDTLYDNPSEKALEIAERFHPNWKALGRVGRLLQGRNSHILFGPDCDDPVDFVICWTEGGEIRGGTGQGLRIAKHHKIPIFNLALEKDEERLVRLIVGLQLKVERNEEKGPRILCA